MLAHDLAQTVFIQELQGIGLELQDDIAAAGAALGRLDREGIGAGANPSAPPGHPGGRIVRQR